MKITQSQSTTGSASVSTTSLLLLAALQTHVADGLTTRLFAPTQRLQQQQLIPLFPQQKDCRSRPSYRHFLRFKNNEDLDSKEKNFDDLIIENMDLDVVLADVDEKMFDGLIPEQSEVNGSVALAAPALPEENEKNFDDLITALESNDNALHDVRNHEEDEKNFDELIVDSDDVLIESFDSNPEAVLSSPEEDEKELSNLLIIPNSASSLLTTDDNSNELMVNIQDISSSAEPTTTSEHIEVNANSVNTKDSTPGTMATAKEILALGLPSLGSCLVDPVMSLVDTACVGQVSTIQLASLAPCTSICQFLFFSFFFLSAATTTFVAANPRSTEAAEAEDADFKAEQIVSSASALSVVLGTLVAGVIFAFTDQLLLLAGCSSTEMLISARKYLQIRAIGLPAVFFTMVIQGASLGRQDAYTPLKVFSAAGIVNLLGDVVLTLGLGWGVTGAAIATTASQCAAAAYFVFRSIQHRRQKSLAPEDFESESPSASQVALKWRGLPGKKVGISFAVMAFTLMLKQIVNMSSYSLMTRKADSMGALALAAHLVTLQVFWMLSFIPEPIGMALQSLVARDKSNGSSTKRAEEAQKQNEEQHEVSESGVNGSVVRRVRKLIRTGFVMSSVTGAIIAILTGFCLTCPLIAKSLVQDVAVREIMVRVAPFAMLAQLICPLSCIADAACLGLNDIKHLPLSTLASTVALVFGLNSIKNVAAVGGIASGIAAGSRGILSRIVGGGVEGIWMTLVLYYVVRAFGNTFMSRKMKKLVFSRNPEAQL